MSVKRNVFIIVKFHDEKLAKWEKWTTLQWQCLEIPKSHVFLLNQWGLIRNYYKLKLKDSQKHTQYPPSEHFFFGGWCVIVLKGVVRLWFPSKGIKTNENKNLIWLVVNLGVGCKGH